MWSTRRLGDLGERMAELFLALKGYEVLRRNYRYASREIDLLVRNDTALVAVEVKLRRGDRFGRAVEAVDARKLARIRVALDGALSRIEEPLQPRIDVVAIDFDQNLETMTARHIEAVG